jgi:hypothetical protein
MLTISNAARRALNDRACRLGTLASRARTRWLEVAGDAFVLDVYDLFARHPGVAMLTISIDAEYTDDGSYFDTPSGTVVVSDDDLGGAEDLDAISEEWNDRLHDEGVSIVMSRLLDGYLREAKITRARALELATPVASRLASRLDGGR